MATLLERNIASIDKRLVVLAPPQASVASLFPTSYCVDPARHDDLVAQMQHLRGSVYLEDGALKPEQLTPDGRHRTREDERSWHLLMLDQRRRVSACIWYLEHEAPASIHELRVRSCPLAESADGRLRDAVHAELARARNQQVRYSEVGGWAVAKDSRCTSEGLILILATFGLSRMFGGALGVATATARHSSAAILRRLGLSRFEVKGDQLRPYFDAEYDCEMEVLRYDTRRASAKYHDLIERLIPRLSQVSVVGRSLQPLLDVPVGDSLAA
jgi:hypothetical protein